MGSQYGEHWPSRGNVLMSTPIKSEVKAISHALSILLPANLDALKKCRFMIQEDNMRPDAFADLCAKDPTIALEIFRVSNTLLVGGVKQPVSTIQAAITRLGNEAVLEVITSLEKRPLPEDEEIGSWIELMRERSARIAYISKLFAELFARTSSSECQMAGLFSGIGEMLAVVHLGQVYVKLAKGQPRATVLYKMVLECKFDPLQVGPSYLLRNGIPQTMVLHNETDAAAKDRKRAVIKPLVHAAEEMVDGYEKGRWEKFAPGNTFPPKSNIRVLQFQGDQYDRLYTKVTDYLQLADNEQKARAAS